MLISVVIPTLNRPAFLLEAVRSVARQSYQAWEAIVVDDGSEPPVAAGSFEDAFGERVRVVRHATPQGVPRAKNAGIRLARGEIVLLLDDDDLLLPEALARISEAYGRHPDLDCLFLGVEPFGPYAEGPAQRRAVALNRIRMRCKPAERDGLLIFSSNLFEALLHGVPIDFQRPAARRGVWNIIGGFDEDALFTESAWAIKVAARCAVALTVEPSTRWRIHDANFGWPSGLRAEQITAWQIDNGLRASEALSRAFEERAASARSQCRQVASAAAAQLFDGAYQMRSIDRMKAVRLLLRSFMMKPRWRHLRLALRLLVPAFSDKARREPE